MTLDSEGPNSTASLGLSSVHEPFSSQVNPMRLGRC